MANEGIPLGGKYPTRAQINSAFQPYKIDTDSVFEDRRTKGGKLADRIYSDQLSQQDIMDGNVDAGAFYRPNSYDISQTYTQQNVEDYGTESAFSRNFVEWDIPTSSTNYARPRTVAAGYSPDPNYPQSDKGVLTVVFRDGTFYNYYEVRMGEWEAFHASYSKGRPWLNRRSKTQSADGLFIHKPRGDAGDMQEIDPQIREALYRVSRTQQQRVKPKMGRTTQTASLYSRDKNNQVRRVASMKVQNRVKSKGTSSANPKPFKPSNTGNRKTS